MKNAFLKVVIYGALLVVVTWALWLFIMGAPPTAEDARIVWHGLWRWQ